MKRLVLAAVALSTPAAAAPIAIAKSATVVSDGVNALNPRVLPGATVEYLLTATNPLLNPQTVRDVAICDVLPDQMTLLTADLVAGKGPVDFQQGLLVASGLAYSYGGLGATNDGLTFFAANGAAIIPTAGSDAKVRKICVALTGTRMTNGGSFTLRYRGIVR